VFKDTVKSITSPAHQKETGQGSVQPTQD
jgi:hypothetical protein